MKILYVEDEIIKNIDRIIRLFSKYLGRKIVKRLKSLRDDEYPPTEEDIKKIVESSNFIELEYRFPNALSKIINQPEKYALFIIDRNLSDIEGYEFDEIAEVDPNYNQEFYDHFLCREGDYLLQKLVYDIDVMAKFYFLTANSNDELRISNEVKTHINNEKFSKENFIEKGDITPLIQVIEKVDILNLQLENKSYLKILETEISEKASDRFIHLLSKKDSNKPNDIFENFGSVRNIFENILTVLAKRVNADKICWNIKNPDQLIIRNFISWVNHYDEEKRRPNYRLNSNSIIKNFLYDIQEIASDFGPHDDLENKKKQSKPSGYQPTTNTVNALVYELKDIILWFGKNL